MKSFASGLLLALIAGPAWAGDAWVAEYAVHDHKGERTLVLVRDEERVEYRLSDEAPRLWRRLQDGVEMRELHPDQKRSLVYSPGDLRTLGMDSAWEQLAGIVDPGLLTKLSRKEESRQFGQQSIRYAGTDANGQPVVMEWLPELALPVRYCIGQPCVKNKNAESSLRLRTLKRMPAEQAFSSEQGLLELDQADLGDRR